MDDSCKLLLRPPEVLYESEPTQIDRMLQR